MKKLDREWMTLPDGTKVPRPHFTVTIEGDEPEPPKSSFSDQLDEILDKLIDDSVIARMKWSRQARLHKLDETINSGFTRYQKELSKAHTEAEASILALIEREVIGEDDPRPTSGHVGAASNQGTLEGMFYNSRKDLRAEQRNILKGANK